MPLREKAPRASSFPRWFFWGAFVVCAGFLFFKNLSDAYLNQDEAETAVLALNTLKFGLPKVFDGQNLVSQNWGKDYDAAYIWNYSPWLGIYAAAGSFSVFGRSTLAARLPFALLGLLTLLLAHRLFLRWSGRREVADLAVWLNLLCVPYLLHARQCRYYMLAAFFAVYLLDAFERWLEDEPAASWHLAAAAAGLFYANFLLFFPLAAGLGLRAFQERRRLRHRWPSAASALPLLPGC